MYHCIENFSLFGFIVKFVISIIPQDQGHEADGGILSGRNTSTGKYSPVRLKPIFS